VRAALLAGTAAQLHRDPVGSRTLAQAAELDQVIAAALRPIAAPRRHRANESTTTAGVTGAESPTGDGDGSDGAVPSPPAGASVAITDGSDDRVDEVSGDGRDAPHSLRTGLGGAFYLLNVLEWLDIPASASGAGEPGPTMNRWGVLAGALAALVGGRHAPAWPGVDLADPLFALLDELSGPSRNDVEAPWAYRCPPAALASLGSAGEPWRWWSAGERLVIVAGRIAIADVPLGGDEGPAPDLEHVVAREQALAVLAGTPDVPALPADPEVAPQHAARSWHERVAGLLTALLLRAHLEPSMVAVPATVELTASTIRVRMRLDDVDLGVRRAGLDRDPGWVPELGRVVDLEFT
jgi:hypothetical protein